MVLLGASVSFAQVTVPVSKRSGPAKETHGEDGITKTNDALEAEISGRWAKLQKSKSEEAKETHGNEGDAKQRTAVMTAMLARMDDPSYLFADIRNLIDLNLTGSLIPVQNPDGQVNAGSREGCAVIAADGALDQVTTYRSVKSSYEIDAVGSSNYVFLRAEFADTKDSDRRIEITCLRWIGGKSTRSVIESLSRIEVARDLGSVVEFKSTNL